MKRTYDIYWNIIFHENIFTLVLCEKLLSKFLPNLYVLRPPESEKTVFTKVSVITKRSKNLDRNIHF